MFNGGECMVWTECATCGENKHPQFPDCYCVHKARVEAANAQSACIETPKAINEAPKASNEVSNVPNGNEVPNASNQVRP